MLRHLTIKDFVIVDRLELEFANGFGALTGETGAGKSILIDALALALGERADAGVVRSGCDKAEVAATFEIAALPEVATWLESNDLDGDDELPVGSLRGIRPLPRTHGEIGNFQAAVRQFQRDVAARHQTGATCQPPTIGQTRLTDQRALLAGGWFDNWRLRRIV